MTRNGQRGTFRKPLIAPGGIKFSLWFVFVLSSLGIVALLIGKVSGVNEPVLVYVAMTGGVAVASGLALLFSKLFPVVAFCSVAAIGAVAVTVMLVVCGYIAPMAYLMHMGIVMVGYSLGRLCTIGFGTVVTVIFGILGITLDFGGGFVMMGIAIFTTVLVCKLLVDRRHLAERLAASQADNDIYSQAFRVINGDSKSGR